MGASISIVHSTVDPSVYQPLTVSNTDGNLRRDSQQYGIGLWFAPAVPTGGALRVTASPNAAACVQKRRTGTETSRRLSNFFAGSENRPVLLMQAEPPYI